MSDVVDFPLPPQAPSIVGPERRGHAVIVEGRAIPGLHCHERGEEVELVLDERFALTLPKAMAHQIASFVANALAVGASYSHLGAASKDRPFAPEVWQSNDYRIEWQNVPKVIEAPDERDHE